ncbi:MAG: 1,2-phenylacetyl-CoA epoxidase subunit PaaD [Anaerolineae bacterium]
METLTIEDIWQALDDIKDPEIPVVSLVELGIVRDVGVTGGKVTVTITPTFSGCPALNVMKAAIAERLLGMGVASVEVRQVVSPAWSSDWISAEGRRKLKEFGLAPPLRHGGDFEILLLDAAACPHCDSQNTTLKNSFGPTLCRALYYCHACRQPFEAFKPL